MRLESSAADYYPTRWWHLLPAQCLIIDGMSCMVQRWEGGMRVWLIVGVMGVLGGCVSPSRLIAPAAVGGSTVPSPVNSGPAVSGAAIRTNSIGMKLVQIPAGTFQMGDPRSALGGTPPHAVTLSTFWVGQFEVTNGEFDRFLKLPRTKTSPTAQHPAANLTWDEADRFCQWLSRKEGKTYRLPTEAEWEYAARGGLAGRDYPWGDQPPDGRAQVAALTTAPVGTFPPNGFGLHDMAGNVQEYVADWYAETYPPGPAVNPVGPPTMPVQRMKVTRDGPFGAWEPYCAIRLPAARDGRYDFQGFRVVLAAERTVAPAAKATGSTPAPAPTITDPEVLAAMKRSPDEALILAINRLSPLTVVPLLKMGARVDLRAYEDVTPMHKVVPSSDSASIKYVLSRGADLNAQDIRGDTPLIYAVRFCEADIVALLLENGARVNQANFQGVTPLMWAANASDAAKVRVLLKKGADRKLVDAEGHDAIWFASKLGNPEAIRELKK